MRKIGTLKALSSLETAKNGVSIGFECLDRDMFKPERCYDLLGKTGCKMARVQTGWSKCEKEKGVYHFEWLDDVVDNLLRRGIRPWFNVGYGNPLYMECSNPTGVGCVPTLAGIEATDAWVRFIKALTAHFKDRVTHYEIWNEPNMKNFWYPGEPNAKQYAALVVLTAGTIKGIQPDAKTGANVSYTTRIDFVKELLANLTPDVLDFFSYHAYCVVEDFGRAFDALYAEWERLLKRYGFENTALWQSESGFMSWAPEGYHMATLGIDDERPQAVYMLRRFFTDFSHGAKVSSFFQIADMWERPYETAASMLKKPGGHGILRGLTYEPKTSYYAFSHLAALFDGDVSPRDCYFYGEAVKYAGWRHYAEPFEHEAIQTMSFTKNGQPMYAYFLPSPITEQRVFNNCFRMMLEEPPEKPVLIDTLTGEMFAFDTITRKEGCTEYRRLPLCDYPMVVTDERTVIIDKA